MLNLNTGKLYFYIKVLSLMGIVLALYLIWQQFSQPAFRPCTINATINCDAIISGEVSKTLGIPTPLIGLAGYTVIFISALLKKKKLILSMAAFGLAFCLYIAFVELFILKVICPVCIFCQLIMIFVFGLALTLVKKRE